MSEKSKVRIQSYISQSLKETIDKYCIKNNTNISCLTNEALLEYFKLKPIEDNLEFLISIIENSHVYLLSKILNQKDIETLKNFEHIIESIIWSAETNDNSIILAYKEDLAENLLLYFECIGVDLKEKIEYGKETIEIENDGDVKE